VIGPPLIDPDRDRALETDPDRDRAFRVGAGRAAFTGADADRAPAFTGDAGRAAGTLLAVPIPSPVSLDIRRLLST
jgi:hypothetical protein